MSTHAGSAANASRALSRACREIVRFKADIAIGASGAASQAASVNGDTGYDDNGITVTKNNTGIYDVTFPKGRRAFPKFTLYSPLLTVVGVVVTAMDATAGTMTFKTLAGTNAAAATEPASGDRVLLDLEVVP